MMYYEFVAGGEEYRLRLCTRDIVSLERQIKCNPISIFGNDGETIPTVSTMVYILHAALQSYNHGITLDDTYNIFDKYLADGHTTIDFVSVIFAIYKVSGIVSNGEGAGGKKNLPPEE